MYSDNIVVGYVRVSTQTQVQHGEGLEIQKQKIQEYCRERKLQLSKIYEDRGISGTVKDRPALLSLLKDCESGQIKKVIVYKQDRLSRELGVSMWLETQFKKYNVELNSVFEPEFDTDDPMGKALKRIISVFAELERDIIASRLRDGRENNAKNGQRGSGPIPFGYLKEGDDLVIYPDEAKWVHKIYRWRIKGLRYSEIINRLNRKDVRTKRGKPFHTEAVKYILQNELYYGATNFGRLRSKGIHEPIVSKRIFFKVKTGKNR